MKKTLAVISLLAGAVGLHAQGSINVQSYVGGTFSTTIYSENYSNPGAAQISGDNNTTDIPSGNTTYANETPLGGTAAGTGAGASGEYNGNNYEVGIYLATSLSALTTAVTSGTTLATGLIYTGNIATTGGAGNAGYYSSAPTVIQDSSIAPGATVYVAMAAWYSAGGAGSYSAAKAAGVPSGYVESTAAVALGGAGSPPSQPPTLAGLGLTSFDLTATPEPSTIALGVMGASALLFRRRK